MLSSPEFNLDGHHMSPVGSPSFNNGGGAEISFNNGGVSAPVSPQVDNDRGR